MRRDVFMLGGLLFALAVFTGATFDTLGTLILLIVLSSAVAGFRFHRSFSDDKADVETGGHDPGILAGWCLLGIAAFITVAWRLSAYDRDNANPILAGADFLSHICVMGCAIGWCLRPARGYRTMLGGGMFAVLACVLAGGASQSLVGQISVAIVSATGFVLASSVILNHAKVRLGFRRTSESKVPAQYGLFSLLVASGILTGTSLTARATNEVLPSVQQYLQDYLNVSLETLADKISIGGTRYVRGSRLGSVRDHIVGSPTEVALRCYADSQPGYLKGTVFHSYGWRGWSQESYPSPTDNPQRGFNSGEIPIQVGRIALFEDDDAELNRFIVRPEVLDQMPADVDLRTIEVHNQPEKGNVTFSALSCIWVEAAANRARFNSDRLITGGIDLTEPYVLGVARESPPEPLSSTARETMLNTPQSIDGLIDLLPAGLLSSQRTARAKADALANYFQSNFTYSLTGLPRRRDPLRRFLSLKHPAHCEYFATATALLLRQAGVPTRYITGYVADEQSTEELYYLARNRDAHAWVEAYDDETNRWFAVESTPGRTYHTVLFEQVDDDLLLDDEGLGGNSNANDESWLSMLRAWTAQSGIADSIVSAFRLIQLPLFVILMGLLWYRGHLRRAGMQDADELASRRMLTRADRVARRRFAMTRGRSETLHQFADRMDARAAEKALGDLALSQWYRCFANDRYRGLAPEPYVPQKNAD